MRARLARSPVAFATAAKFVLLGVMAGSAATVGLTMAGRPWAAGPVAAQSAAAPSVRASAPARAPEPPPDTRHPVKRTSGGLSRRSAASHRAAATSRASAGRDELAAQVSRIDTARTAISVGDYEGAVQLVERYHLDFPAGVLAPDADVVALEAAAAKRDQAEVALRARAFLLRYPNDPHSARVRSIARAARGDATTEGPPAP